MTGFLRRYLTLAFARRRRPRKRSFTQQLVGRRGWHYLRMPTAFCRSHPRLVPMNTQSGILCDPASLVLYGRCRASSRPHARSRKGESRRTLSEPSSPFESKLLRTPIEPSKTSTFDHSVASGSTDKKICLDRIVFRCLKSIHAGDVANRTEPRKGGRLTPARPTSSPRTID